MIIIIIYIIGQKGIVNEANIYGNIFEFIPNTTYMKINYNHGIPVNVTTQVDTNGNLIFINDPYVMTYDISKLTVEIKGFLGNEIYTSSTSYFDTYQLIQ